MISSAPPSLPPSLLHLAPSPHTISIHTHIARASKTLRPQQPRHFAHHLTRRHIHSLRGRGGRRPSGLRRSATTRCGNVVRFLVIRSLWSSASAKSGTSDGRDRAEERGGWCLCFFVLSFLAGFALLEDPAGLAPSNGMMHELWSTVLL